MKLLNVIKRKIVSGADRQSISQRAAATTCMNIKSDNMIIAKYVYTHIKSGILCVYT